MNHSRFLCIICYFYRLRKIIPILSHSKCFESKSASAFLRKSWQAQQTLAIFYLLSVLQVFYINKLLKMNKSTMDAKSATRYKL
jgi:hypothetical protein